MLRPLESIDSTVLPVTVLAAGSSLRLIGPIASMKESQHTDHVVMANVFIRIFFIRIFRS